MPVAEHTANFKSPVRSELVSEAYEKERRKNNVIVSGLAVPVGSSASEQFTLLCEDHLGCKPLVLPDKCVPIDKPVAGRLPRLRITFGNELARNDILC